MIEPIMYAVIIISLMVAWVIYTIWKMKKSFEERGGSYQPIKDMVPDMLKEYK